MANPDGTPVWYELITTDPDGAQRFYADVVGWNIAPFEGGDPAMDYRIVTAPDGQGAGGIMKVPDGAPMQPAWFSYVGVADVDAKAAQVTALGGSVMLGPQDIPGVGRFAFVSDPQGLSFYIMRGDSPEESTAFSLTAPGHAAWNELVTTDHKAALDFYGALFGWRNNESMSMGEMGDYAFIDHQGERIGAMMTTQAGWPTRWTYYFRVPSIAAAKDKVEQAGGTVTHGPHEVPGGDHIIMGTDPQGAAFALVGAE